MNVKVCLIMLLCLLGLSIVYTVAIGTFTTTAFISHDSNNKPAVAKYLTLDHNGTEPDGEGKGGGGWPL